MSMINRADKTIVIMAIKVTGHKNKKLKIFILKIRSLELAIMRIKIFLSKGLPPYKEILKLFLIKENFSNCRSKIECKEQPIKIF